MALDHVNKRSAAINVALPWRGMLPVPDGSIDAGDRAQASDMSRAGAAAPTPAGGSWPSAQARALAAHRAWYGARPEWFEDDAFILRGK